MAQIGDVMLAVRAGMDRFETDILRGSTRAGDKAAGSFTKQFKKATGRGELGKAFVQGLGIGGALGAVNAVTTATSAMVNGIFDSIDAASDQREAMSLNTQVFEANAEQMSSWADDAAEAFGQSKTEALTFAATFGTALKNVGFGLDETSEKSQTLTRLAADLGSAFNATGEEAATAIRSGLIGESEPLRRFGVFLSEAAVNTELVRLGQRKVNGAWTDAQKVLARYNIIMRDTVDSQGMFGRDSESLADAQKRLQAQLDDVQAEIGRKLLPVMVDLAEFASDELIPALADAGDAVGDFVGFLADLNAEVEKLGFGARDATEGPTLLGRALDDLGGVMGTLVDDTADVLTFWDGWTLKSHEIARGVGSAVHAEEDLGRALDRTTGPLRTTVDLSDQLGDEQRDAAVAAGDLKEALLDQANALIDDYYEPIELREEIRENNHRIRTARQVLRSKNASAEERRDAESTITAATKANEKANLALIATGEMSKKQFDGFIKNLDRQIASATGDAKRHLQAVRREALRLNGLVVRIKILQQVTTAGITFTGVPVPRQHGGYVEPGVAYWVGEAGRELFVPSTPGEVVPHSDSERAAESGGGVTVNLSTYGLPMRAETPSETAAALRRVASLGVLRPRRSRPPSWDST